MQLIDGTTQGIYRAATNTIDGLVPFARIVTVQLLQAAASTTQRIPIPGGFTVKYAIAIRNGSENGIDGASYGNNNHSIGFTDGTNEFCVYKLMDPGLGDKTQRSHSDITLVRRHQTLPLTGATLHEAYTGSSVGAGFVDIQTTVKTDDGTDRDQWVTVIAFGGPEVTDGGIWTQDDLGTGTTPVDITTTSAASVIFAASANLSGALSTYDDVNKTGDLDCEYSFGFAINDGSDSQGSNSIECVDQTNPVDSTCVVSNTAILNHGTGGAITYDVTLSGITASKFTLTPSASASNAICGGMWITFSSDVNLAVVDTTFPTAGDYTQSDVGFKSRFSLIISEAGVSAYDTAAQASSMGESITAFTETELFCHSFSWQHGAVPQASLGHSALHTSLQSWQVNPPSSPSTVDMETSGYSLNANGWTFTVTNPPTAAILGKALAIG